MTNEAKVVIDQAYRHLLQAEERRQMVAPLTDMYPHLTVDDAYQIQLKGIARKLGEGRQIVGKKIGLTSVAMQELLGVDQPDYGHLLDHMEVSNRGMIPVSSLFQPKAEAEIAFVLHTDLKGPSVTVEDVLNATEYIVPALEIVDSRITDWTIKLEDTIADNASSGLFVLGNETFSAKEMDLTKVTMDLLRNGQFVNSGSGSAVLGNPAACVAWLANALHDYGVKLEAGEVILSGALSAAIAVQQGDRVTADFHHLGTVEVTFI